MEKYFKDNRIIVCKVLELEKAKSENKLPPYNYSDKEKEAILQLAYAIEIEYLNEFPSDYSETKEYGDKVQNDIKYHKSLLENASEVGQWILPYFFFTPKGTFTYGECGKYQIEFGNTEEFNLAFGFLIRNLLFADVRKVFQSYYDLESDSFIQFLETHLIEYSFLFKDSTLVELSKKWIENFNKPIPEPSISLSSTASQLPNSPAPPVIPEIKVKTEIIEPLFNILKEFFDASQHKDLRAALEGKMINYPLVFLSRGNRLILVFENLKQREMIISDSLTIKYWLLKNFKFFKKGEAAPFKMDTIHKVFNYTLTVKKDKIIDVSVLYD